MKSTISYAGQVTVTIKNKPPKRRPNKGSIALFRAMAEILGMKATTKSQNLLANMLPGYITILKINDDDPISFCLNKSVEALEGSTAVTKVLLAPLPISSRGVDTSLVGETDIWASASFSCLLNNSQLTSAPIQGSATIVLLDGSLTNVLAATEFDLDWLSEVAEDTEGQAAITWEMIFSNK